MRTFPLLIALFILSPDTRGAEPTPIPLWPEGPPGQMQAPSAATADFIQKRAGKTTVTNVSASTMVVYPAEKPNGTCVIVAPGGAYAFLSAVHEGTQVCEWLNTLGVTGVLLNYRTPTRDEAAPFQKPVQDAQRAIGILRHRAQDWGIDPTRIGVLGFSAGGNLVAHLTCDRGPRSYPQDAQHDVERALPDFAIMIYGGGFMDAKDPSRFAAGFSVPKDAPPMFFACAHDDGNNPIAMTHLYLEYKRLGIPSELHICSKGGHGFGMRRAGNPINDWPQRCGEWMQSMGWLAPMAAR